MFHVDSLYTARGNHEFELKVLTCAFVIIIGKTGHSTQQVKSQHGIGTLRHLNIKSVEIIEETILIFKYGSILEEQIFHFVCIQRNTDFCCIGCHNFWGGYCYTIIWFWNKRQRTKEVVMVQ